MLTSTGFHQPSNCRSRPVSFPSSRTKWFANCACTPYAVGLPPSLSKLRSSPYGWPSQSEKSSRDTRLLYKVMTFFVSFGISKAYYRLTFRLRCLPNVCQAINNTLSRWLESVFSCPGREHFYMLIISVLQNFQAKTQAVRNRIWKVSHPYSIMQN